jgi:hypothetical protein
MKNKLNEKTVVKEKTVLEAGKINKQDFPEVLMVSFKQRRLRI